MVMRRFFHSTIGGEMDLPFSFTVNTANISAGSTNDNQFKLPLVSTGVYNFKVQDWGDGEESNTITTWDQADATHTYGSVGQYDITITGVIEGFRFANSGDRLKIIDISNFGPVFFQGQTSAFGGAFRGCENMDISANDSPTFENNAEQRGFLDDCTSLIVANNIENWDVSGITHFGRFFMDASNFNKNIGSWNVSNATDINAMFKRAYNFNNGGSDSIKDWNVSNVTHFGGSNLGMFQQCLRFNQPIGIWNVSNGIVFNDMFRGNQDFNQDIGGWNVSNATVIAGFMFDRLVSEYSPENLTSIYNGWSMLTLNTNVICGFGALKYTIAGQAGRDILTGAPNNWIIEDGGI